MIRPRTAAAVSSFHKRLSIFLTFSHISPTGVLGILRMTAYCVLKTIERSFLGLGPGADAKRQRNQANHQEKETTSGSHCDSCFMA
jgi:hypothetical protein